MTDVTQDQAALLAAMNSLLGRAGAPTAPGQAPAVSAWAQPAPSAPAAIQGVGVPVKVGRGNGNIKIMLFLGPDAASSPAAIQGALDQLEAAGIPIDVWEPSGSGGSWGGNKGGSSWNNRNGGRRW